MYSMGKVKDKDKVVTTLYISKDIYKKVKVHAAKNFKPIGTIVEDAIIAYLGLTKKE